MGSQVLPANLLQHRVSMGSHLPSGIHLLQCRALHGLQVDICSTMDLHGLQGDSLPHHGLHHELQRNLCYGTWSTSSPSFTDLDICRVFSLTYPYSSLPSQFSSPSYIPYHRGATTTADCLGLGQWQVHLGAGWHWLYQTSGKLLASSHRSHTCRAPLTKPGHINPTHSGKREIKRLLCLMARVRTYARMRIKFTSWSFQNNSKPLRLKGTRALTPHSKP